jgi:hypothetical protein
MEKMTAIHQEELTRWNLVENILGKIPLPYYTTCFFISAIFVSIYEIFGQKVVHFNWGYNRFDSIILSILIGLLLFGIQFFLNKMRDTLDEISDLFEDKNLSRQLRLQIQDNFSNSKMNYFLIVLMISPFVIMQIRGFLLKGIRIFFYGQEPTYWAIALDVYNNLLSYISIFLLAAILWIIINIYSLLNLINSPPYVDNLKINIFDVDRMGGLRPLMGVMASVSVYYFILIMLFIMSWLVPNDKGYGYRVLPYESAFLVIFWVIGASFFLIGWHAIRRLLSVKFEDDVNRISDLCQYKTQQLSEKALETDLSESEKHLTEISKSLDVLHKERDRILKLGAKPMDIKTFLLFLGSSIPSCIAILKTLDDARKIELINISFDKLLYVLNNLTDYFK